MERRDLQREDCSYVNSFPANIDWGMVVVVQIPERWQGVILYTCKNSWLQASCYLPLLFKEKYTNDIYIFGA